jgi:hypothetical protein
MHKHLGRQFFIHWATAIASDSTHGGGAAKICGLACLTQNALAAHIDSEHLD